MKVSWKLYQPYKCLLDLLKTKLLIVLIKFLLSRPKMNLEVI